MTQPLFFESIPLAVPVESIYRRLGYRKGTTRLGSGGKAEVDSWIAEARSLLRLRGAGLRLPILERSPSRIFLPGSTVFESRDLSAFLRDCREIALVAATGGNEILDAIRADTAGGRLTRGVVFDAVASEMVDASLDWITAYFRQALSRMGMTPRKGRFSAGYGDFRLQNQKAIYGLLELHRLGVAINESFILIPEKSVTAVLGIRTRN